MTRHHGGYGKCSSCYGTGLKRYANTPGLYWCHCPIGRKAAEDAASVEEPVEQESPVDTGKDLWDSITGFPV